MKQYGSLHDSTRRNRISAKLEFAVKKQTVYQGQVLAVNHYRLQMPGGKVIERDIVERPESVLILPIGQKKNVILIEEYDLAADTWQLTLPGGNTLSGKGWYVKIEGEEASKTGGSYAHQVSTSDPRE